MLSVDRSHQYPIYLNPEVHGELIEYVRGLVDNPQLEPGKYDLQDGQGRGLCQR